jgi:alkaline phosphatase
MVCLGGDFSASGQANLPFRGVDSSYSQRVCERSTVIQDNVTRLPTRVVTNSTICNYYPPAELANIPNITTNVIEGLKFLAKDNDGFFMMYEQGDIDWAAHANHMDDMLGAVFDIDDTVTEILKWISQNGGWTRNALYVTADHDHYLTLLPDFPEKLARLIIAGRSYEITPRNNSNVNPQDLANAAFRFNDTKSQIEDLLAFSTWSPEDIVNVGHFWGPRGSGGNGWGSHSTRPVPLYYNGDNGCIEKLTGTPFQVLGRVVPGIEDKIDQTHLHACMLRNLFGLPTPPCVPTYAVYSGNLNYWYKTITPGGTIATPPCEINIEARFCTPPTGPVTIQLLQGGNVIRSRVEALAPYFLFGDSPANVLSGAISPGTYEIRTIVGGNTSATTSFTFGACA